MRQMAMIPPRKTPCLATASMAYCEQEGTNRHTGGKRGEIKSWYPLKTAIRQALGMARHENRSRRPLLGPDACGSSEAIALYLHNRAGDRKQRVLQRILMGIGKIRPDGDDDIAVGGELLAVQPKTLAEQPLDPVPLHRIANLARHTDPQTTPRQGIGEINDRKPLAAQSRPGPVDALKLPVLPQQMLLGEAQPPQAAQADSCLRPLARRRLITAWPFLVFMRTRNPWVRARLMTLGWKVLLLIICFLYVNNLR